MDSIPSIAGGASDFTAGDLRDRSKSVPTGEPRILNEDASTGLFCEPGDDQPVAEESSTHAFPTSFTSENSGSSNEDFLPEIGTHFGRRGDYPRSEGPGLRNEDLLSLVHSYYYLQGNDSRSERSSSTNSETTACDDDVPGESKATGFETELQEIVARLKDRAKFFDDATKYLQGIQDVLHRVARQLNQLREDAHVGGKDQDSTASVQSGDQGTLTAPDSNFTRSSRRPWSLPLLAGADQVVHPASVISSHVRATASRDEPLASSSNASAGLSLTQPSFNDTGTQEAAPLYTTAPAEQIPIDPGYLCLDCPQVIHNGLCPHTWRKTTISEVERKMWQHRFYAHAKCRSVFDTEEDVRAHRCFKACSNSGCSQHIFGERPPTGSFSCQDGCVTTKDERYVILIHMRHGEHANLAMLRNVRVPARPVYVHGPTPITPIPHPTLISDNSNISPAHMPLTNSSLPFFTNIIHDPTAEGFARDIRSLYARTLALQQQVATLSADRQNHAQRQDVDRQAVIRVFRIAYHAWQFPGVYSQEDLVGEMREALQDAHFDPAIQLN